MNAHLFEALARIVGSGWVRHRKGELTTYAMDGLPTHESLPGVVVMPGTPYEVRELVRLLHLIQVPFVARGAGTGLSGGALADADAVLITLTRLNRILRVDPIQRRAVVQPGVVNARLSEAVAPLGLQYVPDPSSQAACTVGGNVAENAGGPHCLKYGVTTNHIVSLEVVLPDGSITRFGSEQGEPWGPDLVGLFVAGFVIRVARAAMIETLAQDYIRAARAKGLRRWTVVLRHGVRNASLPIATILGLQFGLLLGGAAVTETVFSYPGMGKLLIDSILRQDFPQIQASIIVLTIVYLIVNLLVDLTYGVLDPRIRTEQMG
jgi:FAD/FMN-containing dehydrogenase